MSELIVQQHPGFIEFLYKGNYPGCILKNPVL